jgi:o-succinylbenzoate---CoA ligase
VSVTGHLAGGPGELVAVDLPPGEHWLDVLADLWWRGVSVLPVDHRLSASEKAEVLERARPSVEVSVDGPTVFAGGVAADPERAAVVVATSGTGGVPRLVEIPRHAVEAALSASNQAVGAAPDDAWLAVLSPAHIGGLLVYLRHAAHGTPVAAHERFEPAALDGTGSAFASAVPTMVRRLVEARARLSGVTLVVGGGPLDAAIRAGAVRLGARVFSTYGSTETCGGVVYDGAAIGGARLRIAEDDTIEVTGPTVMEGYRGDPAATAIAFTTDGWLRTGDLGAIDADGRLTVHGRADELIRTGAEKVWPAEVETVLAHHPKVREVAVAGRPDPDWGEHVAAWVVPRLLEEPPSLEELREYCRDELARYKAPRELFLTVELPRTSSGKIRRAMLPTG